jgi:uncharacterized membrane protein
MKTMLSVITMKTMLSVIGPLWVIVHAILAAVNLYLGEIGWFFAHLTLSFIHVSQQDYL